MLYAHVSNQMGPCESFRVATTTLEHFVAILIHDLVYRDAQNGPKLVGNLDLRRTRGRARFVALSRVILVIMYFQKPQLADGADVAGPVVVNRGLAVGEGGLQAESEVAQVALFSLTPIVSGINRGQS